MDKLSENTAKAFVWGSMLLVSGLFLSLLFYLFQQGFTGLSWNFLTAMPEDSGRGGGIASVLVSTTLILIVCLTVSLPIGMGTSILLAEYHNQDTAFERTVRRSLDMLAGTPSILFGLFGNIFFCITLGMGYSLLAGGFTLACMILPLFIRVYEEGLRTVPLSYRLASHALGLSKSRMLFSVILPETRSVFIAALVLSMGRSLAETAALLFTSGYVTRMPESLFDSGRSVSVHIYDLAMNIPGGEANASASALLLILFLFSLNRLTRFLIRQKNPQTFNTGLVWK